MMKINNMNKDLKTVIITISILVVFGVATFFIGKYLGKKSEETGNKAELPDDIDWTKTETIMESEEAQMHAAALYKDMKGWNIKMRDTTIYTSYLATSDRVFVATATYFEKNYGKGENLAQWINGEHYFLTNYFELDETIKSIIKRLEKFGIKA